MEQYVFSTGYDAPDFDACVQRANLFDIGRENCVQIAEQLTFWDSVRLLCYWFAQKDKGFHIYLTIMEKI